MGLSQYTQGLSIVTDIPSKKGYVVSPAIAMGVVTEALNDEAGSTITGRYHPAKGYAAGIGTPLRKDTFLNGTAGRSGRAFNVVSGVWKDDSQGVLDTYRIVMADSTPGVVWEVISAATTPELESANVVLRRGFPPVGSALVYDKANTYCYLHLCYGNRYDYRFCVEYGQPFRLDRTSDSGATWGTVAIASKLGNTERWLAANNNEIPVRFEPDQDTGEMWVEIGDGHWLHDVFGISHLGANPDLLLPNPGKLRLIGKNGWVSLEYYPLRHAPVTTTKNTPLKLAAPHANAANAQVVVNGLTPAPAGQTVVTTVNTDGRSFTWSATASLPDAGEGQGSDDAPKLSDSTLLIEEVWDDHVPGDASFPQQAVLRQLHMERTQSFDDTSRTLTTSGKLIVQNSDGLYTGVFGNMAIDVYSGDPRGGAYTRVCSGIAGTGEEGITFLRSDPTRIMIVPFTDNRVVMQVPLMTEVILDGWCLYSAVRWLCRAGNRHPQFLQTIPPWPDGPADASCPWPVLASGTGLNAKYKFTPELDPWYLLGLIVQDTGLPISAGVSLPFYMGDTSDGQFHFEAFDPLANPPSALFTTNYSYYAGNPSVFPILGQLEVFNSTAQMRSAVNLQGLNAITYELMQYHAETSSSVRKALGYRYEHLERRAQFSTPEYIQAVGDVDVAISSLPSQIVALDSFYTPGLEAGMTILVEDARALGRLGVFVITGLHDRSGQKSIDGSSGARENVSSIIARNVEAYPSQYGFIF
jgi:hypothetical protein